MQLFRFDRRGVILLLLLVMACHREDQKHRFLDKCHCGEPVYSGDQELVKLMGEFKDTNHVFLHVADIFIPDNYDSNSYMPFILYKQFRQEGACTLVKTDIYNSINHLVATIPGGEKWDGLNKNGKLREGKYHYKSTISFKDRGEVIVEGEFCMIECVSSKDDITDLEFPGDLHPTFIFFSNFSGSRDRKGCHEN